MKNKKTSLILTLIMLTALAGGLVLVKNNQETRRGAYFSGAQLTLSPDDVRVAAGNQATVNLFVSTDKLSGSEDYAKLSSLDTQICFGSHLDIKNPETQVILEQSALKDILVAKKETVSGKTCLRLAAIAGMTAKPTDLKSGVMFKVATIKFDGVSAGSGKIEILADKTLVGGYNPTPGASDTSLKVGSVHNINYEVSGGGTGVCNRCSKVFDFMRTSWNASNCDVDPGAGVEVNRSYDASCQAPEATRNPNQCSRCSKVNNGEYVWWVKAEGKTCSDDPAADADIYRAPRSDCQIESGVWPVLNYKMAFVGVNPDSHKCLVNWPIQIMVMGPGETDIYRDVVPSKAEKVGSKLVFSGSLSLNGFNKLENVAVFIKGPKHLQMKYGKDNQTEAYNLAGGQITLTKDVATSPVYDFSGYPLLAGDVVSEERDDEQDGWINARDFLFVRSKAAVFESVAVGGNLRSDLNGDCQANSNDVNILKGSLQSKQEQLY